MQSRSTAARGRRVEARVRQLSREIGAQVFADAPAAGDILNLISDEVLESKLHVRVSVDPATPWIPWEILIAPGKDSPLSLSAASFLRLSDTQEFEAAPTDQHEVLRVLLVVARPDGDDDVPFRSVASRIVHAAAQAIDALAVEVLRPATLAALEQTVSRAAKAGTPYDVVHFDGHGVYRAAAFAPVQRGYLRFEGAAGGAEEVDGRTVGELLLRHGVGILLLNACRSAFTDRGEPGNECAFGSLATDALVTGLGSVLAMGFNIYVVTAAKFIAHVYAALGAGRSVGEAVAHARRERARATNPGFAGALDWVVPVLYDSDTPSFVKGREEIPAALITTSTTTPGGTRVIDPEGRTGPRDDKRPFYGRDSILLRLERALQQPMPIELIGLGGSGKSALAAEFARWWCATGGTPGVAAVVDVWPCSSFRELAEVIAARRGDVGDRPTLWVLDGMEVTTAWLEADREQLTGFLDELTVYGSRALLTGRVTAGLVRTITIALDGLNQEERLELAIELVGEAAATDVSVVPLLEWTGGIPALVCALPDVLRAAEGLSLHEIHDLLWVLRSADESHQLLQEELREKCGLEIFDVRALASGTLPLALHLYQGFISTLDWEIFCGMGAIKGLSLTKDPGQMHSELAAAQQAGLACRTSPDRYVLHPLAPICLKPGYLGTVAVLSKMNPDLTVKVFKLMWAVYCQAASTIIRMPEIDREVVGGLPARRHHRQNLWHATDLALKAPWWGLAFPLLQLLREALLTEGRVEEWQAVLTEALATMDRFPPKPDEMGPEDLTRHVALLRADARRLRDEPEALAALRTKPIVARDPKPIQLVDEQGSQVGHVEENRQFSQLMELADASAQHRSPDSVVLYQAALSLAERNNDDLRAGEAQLALGRAYLNVPEIRDLTAYEHFARQAVQTGQQMDPFGADLVARGKLGVGNAIAEQLQESGELSPERLREAQAALGYAATADASDPGTRASARNGLGNLAMLEDKPLEAANQYLQAAADFESLNQTENLVVAQANAASALAGAGNWEDARDIAEQARRSLARAPHVDQRVRAILDAIVPNGASNKDEHQAAKDQIAKWNADLETAYEQGDLTTALALASAVHDLAWSAFGYDSEEVAVSLSDLGTLSFQLGHVEEAATYLQRALEAWRLTTDRRGRYSQSFPTTLGSLARVYVAAGRYQEAEPLLLELFKTESGHPGRDKETFVALIRLGELLNLMGRPSEALPILSKASDLLSSVSDRPDYDTLKCVEYQGQALLQLGRLAEAQDVLGRAAAGYRALQGAGAPDELLALNQLGQAEYLLGNYQRAQELFASVLEQLERQPGPNEHEIATTLDNLASVAARLEGLDKATELQSRAVAVGIEAHGDSHPLVVRMQVNQAGLLAEAGDFSSAERVLDDIIRRTADSDASAIDRADALALRASLHERSGRMDSAESDLREASRLRGASDSE